MSQILSAIEMEAEDRADYAGAVAALRRIMNRRLDSAWTFKDKESPMLAWDGILFLRAPREQAIAEDRVAA